MTYRQDVPPSNTRYAAYLGGALAWSAFLLLLAIVLPIYTVTSGHGGIQPRSPVVHVFGYRVLLLVAIPGVITIVVGLLLRLRDVTVWRWPGFLAWGLAVATFLAAIVGTVTFLVGAFAGPVGILLCVATYTASHSGTYPNPPLPRDGDLVGRA